MDEMNEETTRAEIFERTGSALRRSSRGNPRSLACPTCKKPNALTARDARLGYQCDECAARAEAGIPGY